MSVVPSNWRRILRLSRWQEIEIDVSESLNTVALIYINVMFNTSSVKLDFEQNRELIFVNFCYLHISYNHKVEFLYRVVCSPENDMALYIIIIII